MNYFSSDYQKAREQFINRAKENKLYLEEFPNTSISNLEKIYTDIAISYSKNPSNKAFVICSGVHGVEGFCGSAIQNYCIDMIEKLQNGNSCDIILIHALNPYGFLYLRRVNENNIDINRNFIDFNTASRANESYAIYDPLFVPDVWGSSEHETMKHKLNKLIMEKGFHQAQEDITSGQYTHPEGLFYGGVGSTWSRLTLENIASKFLHKYKHIVYLDLHTGLGDFAAVNLIYDVPKHAYGYALALDWFGPMLSSTHNGGLSSILCGSSGNAIPKNEGETISLTLEIGTKPPLEVFYNMLAEHWLHIKKIPENELIYKTIKSQFKETFCPNDLGWQETSLEKGYQVINRVLDGLRRLH